MAPIEFRPVRTEELPEIRKRATAGARQPGQPVPAPGGEPRFRMDFAANADGPWARSAGAIRLQVLVLAERLRVMRELPARERAATMVEEYAALGTFTAARWTLGLMPERPLDGVVAPVCDAEVNEQLRQARRVFDCEGEGWDFAYGVLMWLGWLTGGVDQLPFTATA